MNGALGISGGTGKFDSVLNEETAKFIMESDYWRAGHRRGTGVDLDGRYLIPPTATDGKL